MNNYIVYDEEEEPYDVKADTAKDAALKWVVMMDHECDYTFSAGERVERIKVECPDKTHVWFNVSAKMEIYYSADPIKEITQ